MRIADATELLLQDVEDCFQVLTAVAADLDKYEREEEALKAIKGDIAESSRALSENKQKLVQVQRALKSAETRLDRLDAVMNNRRAEAERRVELVSEQMAKLRLEKEEMKRIEESKKGEGDDIEIEVSVMKVESLIVLSADCPPIPHHTHSILSSFVRLILTFTMHVRSARSSCSAQVSSQ